MLAHGNDGTNSRLNSTLKSLPQNKSYSATLNNRIRLLFVERVLSVDYQQASCTSEEETIRIYLAILKQELLLKYEQPRRYTDSR